MRLQDVVELTSRDGRVCPQPKIWQQLWEMLPEKKQTGAGWQPPLPLILAAWSETNDEAKQQRFHLHLRYADEHGALDKVSDYLQALEPRDWHLRAIP